MFQTLNVRFELFYSILVFFTLLFFFEVRFLFLYVQIFQSSYFGQRLLKLVFQVLYFALLVRVLVGAYLLYEIDFIFQIGDLKFLFVLCYAVFLLFSVEPGIIHLAKFLFEVALGSHRL